MCGARDRRCSGKANIYAVVARPGSQSQVFQTMSWLPKRLRFGVGYNALVILSRLTLCVSRAALASASLFLCAEAAV